MLTTSNTQYNTQRMKTVATVQTFKKQYSFKAWIAAGADPGEGPGRLPPPPYVSTTMRPEGPKTKFWTPPPPPPPIHCSNGGSKGGAGGARPPCFSTKIRPEGPKKKILESGLPPHLRVWWPPPFPPPPSLKVWIRHSAVTSARRRPRRDSEFCKRLKREKLNRSQKVCLKESE